jgi:uncharacterized protein YndB with AHSA1/START domain
VKFDIAFERIYPHPLRKVWRALTDRELLGQWLMETDFVPERGASFQMWCQYGEGGTDRYLCELIEFEPPRRMVWSWVLDERQNDGAMHVEFTLKEVPEGTHLRVRHFGDRDQEIIDAFQGGWPVKLDQLEEAMRSNGSTNSRG